MKHPIPFPDSHEAHDELQQAMFFDGDTYDHDVDGKRLGKQMRLVGSFMGTGKWWTLQEISLATGYPEASISARLRDLRKPRFGEHTVERRRCAEGAGTWEYRVTATEKAQDERSTPGVTP